MNAPHLQDAPDVLAYRLCSIANNKAINQV